MGIKVGMIRPITLWPFPTKVLEKAAEKGYSVIPLSLYFSGSRVKMEIGLCRGKKLYDKRDDMAKADAKRDMERAYKSNGREY